MDDKSYKLKCENIIWITYIFISIFAIISNVLEDHYNKFHILKDKKMYKEINITIFIVAIIIYLYFINLDIKDFKKRKYSKLHLFAATLFFIAGCIYLYIECKTFDEDEIAIM